MSLPDGYRISLDPAELQMEVIHGYLTRSYWSPGVPIHAVERAARNSLVAGVYGPSGSQVGFARMVTDHAGFGYLADVFVLEEHQGKGLGKALVQALMDLPEVKDFRTILLLTQDAHRLYEAYGFQRVKDSSPYMAVRRPCHYPPA